MTIFQIAILLSLTFYTPKAALIIPSTIVSSTDAQLSRNKGLQLYKNQFFSGTIATWYTNGQIKKTTTFFKGKAEGFHLEFYQNGAAATKRYYRNNQKSGTHTGWWENGQQKFEFNYQNGVYEGNVKEWYSTGQIFRNAHFSKGYENGTQQMWKADGSIQANYVLKNGRRYGLLGKKLCQ